MATRVKSKLTPAERCVIIRPILYGTEDISAMEWTLLKREDYITANWTGGTTTQLAIAPEGAQYADRDFLWRISSAEVELEHSDFTPLPDYDRFLTVLSGDLTLKVGSEERSPLPRLTVRTFDGGVPTQSWGKCTDFNLMLRKGRCIGTVRPMILPAGGFETLLPESCGDYTDTAVALFCVSGALTLPETKFTARSGELLLCRKAARSAVKITAQTDTELIALLIHSN